MRKETVIHIIQEQKVLLTRKATKRLQYILSHLVDTYFYQGRLQPWTYLADRPLLPQMKWML